MYSTRETNTPCVYHKAYILGEDKHKINMMYEEYTEYEDYDMPKDRHRKLSKGNQIKTKKAKHKHQYIDCTFKCPSDALGRMRWSFWDGKYCSICGKVQIGNWLQEANETPDAILIDSLWQKEIKL